MEYDLAFIFFSLNRQGNGLGVVATANMSVGSTVFSVPNAYWITPKVAAKEFPGWADMEPIWALTFWVAYHRFIGISLCLGTTNLTEPPKDPFQRAFVASLPETCRRYTTPDFAPFMSRELPLSYGQIVVTERREAFRAVFTELKEDASEYDITDSHLSWAHCIVATRQFIVCFFLCTR